jgi:hypothetical protein
MLRVNEEMKEIYMEKLDRYIVDKETMVLEINKKKSKNKIKAVVPGLSNTLEVKAVTEFIDNARKVPKNYEQVTSEELRLTLSSGFRQFVKKNQSSKEEKEQQ